MNIDRKKALLDQMRGGLIVSCQTQPGDVIHDGTNTVVLMAKAAEWAGAVGIRSNSPEQVKAIHEAVNLPIIGLHKIKYDCLDDVIMTPTIEHAIALWEAGARIIALDSTQMLNHIGKPRCDLIPIIKKELPEAIIFADIDTYDNALHAIELGADIVAPTMCGYTKATEGIEPPDLREFARMCRDFKGRAEVIMDGHIYTPEDAMKAIYLGAHSVVVGSAITRPQLITKRFVDLLGGLQDNWRDAEKTWTGITTNA